MWTAYITNYIKAYHLSQNVTRQAAEQHTCYYSTVRRLFLLIIRRGDAIDEHIVRHGGVLRRYLYPRGKRLRVTMRLQGILPNNQRDNEMISVNKKNTRFVKGFTAISKVCV